MADQPTPDELLAQIDGALAHVLPHNRALGIRALSCGPGWIVLRLPYAERLVGDPETGALHGGAIAALLDAGSGFALFLKLLAPGRASTLDLRIDYLRPAEPGRDVLARAECHTLTREVAFVRALAYHDDQPDDPIACSASTLILLEGT
jgi:uncharacterized protein (TIGR00369 family)